MTNKRRASRLQNNRIAILASAIVLLIAILGLSGCENGLLDAAKALQAEAVSPRILVLDAGSTAIAAGGLVDFGPHASGSTTDISMTIENTGNSDLIIDIDSLLPSGINAAEFSVTANPPSRIAAGGSGSIMLRFSPTSTSAKSATLVITTNDTRTPAFMVRLQGNLALSALTASVGTLSPAFNPMITAYDLVLPQVAGSITMSGTKSDPGCTLSFNPSQPANLDEGVTIIQATVTAPSGPSTTYTITVTRTPSPPTIAVTGTGITRTVTITKPASCPTATVFYATNGIDAGNPVKRIPYTLPLTVAGLGVQVEVQAVAVVNGVDSTVATTTSAPKIAYTGLTIGTTFTTPANLPPVDAATAISGTTIYYSDDMGSVKKYNISTTASEVIAGVPYIAPMLDSAGHGVDARFNRIRDIITDGINLYILTNKSILKLNLSTFDVSIIAALPSWAQNYILNAATDGTYIYFNGITLFGYLGSIKISDGSYAQIGSHDITGYFSSLAWDGSTLHSTVMAGYAAGTLQTYTFISGTNFTKNSFVEGNLTQAIRPSGIVVTGSQSYIAFNYNNALNIQGPVYQIAGASTFIANKPTNRMFTDGVYIYGFGSNDTNIRKGTLYRLQ